MRKLSFTTLILLFSVFILWNSCTKPDNKTEENRSLNPTASDTLKLSGLKEIPKSELAAMAVATAPPISVANLDKVVNLKMPSIGYQGSEGSCVAWGSAYATMSYHFFQPDSTGDLDNAKICSPEYLYNQVKVGSCDGGSYFVDYNGNKGALNILQEQGVCIWSLMPYTDAGCITQPNQSQKDNAAKQQLERFERIADLSNINQLKVYLSKGMPIIIGARLDEGFMNIGTKKWTSASGRYVGNHAMVICGYDDTQNAFKLMNSWG